MDVSRQETRFLLERSVEVMTERVDVLIARSSGLDAVRSAQDDLSEAVAALAGYLLVTREDGWAWRDCGRAFVPGFEQTAPA